jgi:ABC-type transporter Mla MlaB component
MYVLRITINEDATKVMLKLEGRIVGPWTTELERAWHSLGPFLAGRKLSLDLRGVSYIDPEGRGILADIYRKTQAEFQTDTPLTEYFVQEARSDSSKHGNGIEKGASK